VSPLSCATVSPLRACAGVPEAPVGRVPGSVSCPRVGACVGGVCWGVWCPRVGAFGVPVSGAGCTARAGVWRKMPQRQKTAISPSR
jgi:hypothetical protein